MSMDRPSQIAETALKFGLFETSFAHAGDYDNPYTELTATAELTEPDGKTSRRIPLFWDGGRTWKLRFSPDLTGTWQWSVQSDDAGLDGRSGRLEVADAQNRGSIGPMAGRPYHFQRQNGEPFWFMGDTGWALYTDDAGKKHDRAAVEAYIDTRAAQGFNVIHSMMISESGWGNSGGDAFDDLQAERINPAYWQEVDARLAYLNRAGITGGLVLAWADKGANSNDWREFPSQDARLRYARYAVARYSAFDVYFVVAGEWNADIRNNPDLSEEQVRNDYIEIGRAVDESDPHGRMVAIHPGGGRSVREFATEAWNDFGDYQQTYPRLHTEILASRQFDKPVVNAEYAYYLRDADEDGEVDKNNSTDIDSIRHATWDIVMAGGYFVTGFGNTYFGGYRNPTPFDVDAPQNDIWEAQIQHVRSLFTGREWWLLEPCDELLSAPVERSADRSHPTGRRRPLILPPEVAYWALAEQEKQYVAYVRGVSEAVTLSLGSGGGQAYRLRQFDPRTGEISDLGIHSSENPVEYTPPDARDWVLIVDVENA